MKIHSVVGGGGVKLHVREWGKADAPPVLFIHGWSQNHLCWRKQYESQLADAFRLVAFDLRDGIAGGGVGAAPPQEVGNIEKDERHAHQAEAPLEPVPVPAHPIKHGHKNTGAFDASALTKRRLTADSCQRRAISNLLWYAMNLQCGKQLPAAVWYIYRG